MFCFRIPGRVEFPQPFHIFSQGVISATQIYNSPWPHINCTLLPHAPTLALRPPYPTLLARRMHRYTFACTDIHLLCHIIEPQHLSYKVTVQQGSRNCMCGCWTEKCTAGGGGERALRKARMANLQSSAAFPRRLFFLSSSRMEQRQYSCKAWGLPPFS